MTKYKKQHKSLQHHKKSAPDEGFDRRTFLKTSGAVSAVAGGVGLGLFGVQAGRDPASYTGTETFQGAAQTFDRDRFAVAEPHYQRNKTGTPRRIDARCEVIFSRLGPLFRLWKEDTGVEGLPEPLRTFYRQHPEALKLDRYFITDLRPKQRHDSQQYGSRLTLAKAWANAMAVVWPERDTRPPAEADFPQPGRDGKRPSPMKMKSAEKTSRLIKQMAYELGSVLVGITALNPNWVYQYPMRDHGFPPDDPIVVPEHWRYAIVVGTPMSWDPFLANPNYGTSSDAYSKSRIVGFRLAEFIRQLGYPARPHTPGTDYDLVVPPIVIDAGLGEQGRHGVVVTPELGSNFRPAIVTTNLPLQPDQPIEFGVQDFCRYCKICAENCPSGAITHGGKVDVRGYRRYKIDVSKCHNFWGSKLGNMGCRLCMTTCPYSRKSNWMHRAALTATSNDPFGLTHPALTLMQKRFYPGPEPSHYYMPSLGGNNASYREPPWWLRAEDFIDFNS
ncbi:MAG: reductive dehalogenase [Myxococcota bacterium]|nr:reductive dehalogenase [Myxococcota bacterium]